jgi:para-nitrobenzyl esterase
MNFGQRARPDASSDQNYLGIPYAAPPLGNLRWEPPQAPTPYVHAAATAYGNGCAQAAGSTVTGSEDCLFLNVVRPDDA